MSLSCKYLLLLAIVLFLFACQGEEGKSTSTSAPSPGETEMTRPVKKTESAPLEKKVAEEINVVEKQIDKVEEPAAKVDLKVSGDYLEKIDEESEDYLVTPPKPGESVIGSPRKIEVSGGVILDDKEKDLTKKLDGGEVEIKIPIN